MLTQERPKLTRITNINEFWIFWFETKKKCQNWISRNWAIPMKTRCFRFSLRSFLFLSLSMLSFSPMIFKRKKMLRLRTVINQNKWRANSRNTNAFDVKHRKETHLYSKCCIWYEKNVELLMVSPSSSTEKNNNNNVKKNDETKKNNLIYNMEHSITIQGQRRKALNAFELIKMTHIKKI